ncbi:MAG: esterase [Rariglobus sp.]|jgi:predicted alpha/beta superfamily hydrolase|nr:esterase [Rariglobus sp.]
MANARKAVSFHVTGLDTRYVIYVDVPEPAPTAAEPWITVLCLDGDDQFDAMRKARKAVAGEHALPPLLLVGIGYGASYTKPGNRRARDYTPVAIPEETGAGGAEAFLEFLTGSVWPEIERRYPVHATLRGIAGYSLGGLFALHALFKPRPFFNRVLAASPSIWWGERAILNTVTTIQTEGVVLPARLFLSVGLKDSQSMTGDLGLLERELAERPVGGLEVRSARFPGRSHFNAISVSFRTGLAELFAPAKPGAGVDDI